MPAPLVDEPQHEDPSWAEYPKWVLGQIVYSEGQERALLDAQEPPISQSELDDATADAERDLMASLDVTPRADPLDHDGDGRKGGSRRKKTPTNNRKS